MLLNLLLHLSTGLFQVLDGRLVDHFCDDGGGVDGVVVGHANLGLL